MVTVATVTTTLQLIAMVYTIYVVNNFVTLCVYIVSNKIVYDINYGAWTSSSIRNVACVLTSKLSAMSEVGVLYLFNMASHQFLLECDEVLFLFF